MPRTFTREELELCRDAQVPDLIGPGCKLLFVGINPGLGTAMTGVHFGSPSNRFWKGLKLAGVIDWEPGVRPLAPSVPTAGSGGERYRPDTGLWVTAPPTDRSRSSHRGYPALDGVRLIEWPGAADDGMTDAQRDDLMSRGIGITNLVARATARASELSREELAAGGRRLTRIVEEIEPVVVAVAGVTAYRGAFDKRDASLGRQPEGLCAADLWVVPNPSGLNAHETISTLAEWYGRVAAEAGVV